MAVTWGVTIPFREDPNPAVDRGALLRIVLDHLGAAVPGVPVALIDSDPTEPFNRAGARNECVRHAEAHGWDVVFILDADTLPPAALIIEAVTAAADGGIHQPFRYCVTLSDHTVTPEALTPKTIRGKTVRLWVSPGSCYVLRPDVYWSLGGQDEGFIHWGGEDSAFVAVARAFGVPIVRHTTGQSRRPEPGNTAVQLHHGGATDRRQHPTYPATKQRQAIYERLIRNPSRMRAWLAERYLPHSESKWSTEQAPATSLRRAREMRSGIR